MNLQCDIDHRRRDARRPQWLRRALPGDSRARRSRCRGRTRRPTRSRCRCRRASRDVIEKAGTVNPRARRLRPDSTLSRRPGSTRPINGKVRGRARAWTRFQGADVVKNSLFGARTTHARARRGELEATRRRWARSRSARSTATPRTRTGSATKRRMARTDGRRRALHAPPAGRHRRRSDAGRHGEATKVNVARRNEQERCTS